MNDNETAIRIAYQAYAAGDVDSLLAVFSADLEWTYLDPGFEDPAPRVCHGLTELRRALQRQSKQGLTATIEEMRVKGDKVMVAIHMPGLDQLRVRKNNDRNYDVFTFRDGQIVAMRACHDRAEALTLAGIAPQSPERTR